MYSRNVQVLSEEEQHRLYEIQFYLILYRLIKNFNDSATALDIIQYVAKLTDCNDLHISNAILNCIQKKKQFVPTIHEVHVLLYKAGYAVRTINNITGSSNQKIYNSIKKYEADPYPIYNRLSISTDNELEKILTGLHNIVDLINLW